MNVTKVVPIKRLLIANRGEIACRIIKTARRMNIETVAIYSVADKNAMHVRLADKSHQIGEQPEPQKSYLDQDRILEIARKYNACAIHPGYGFLSENFEFSQRCLEERVVFVGPKPKSIRSMGIKNESKRIMISAGVPVVPGYHGDNQDDHLLLDEARKIGYPIMIKPVRGGGGKGMRVVNDESEFLNALESSRRESLKSFNDQSMLLEKFIERPRHVEVQVFGDMHNNHVYLYERDCSIQRRHQKIIEEAPAPLISDEKRRELGEKAVAAAKAVDYQGAGTVEFILDKLTNEFYFMEMNTRLQVEHPITEMVTGTDLVEWQLRVASGEELPKKQNEIKLTGHAFEARVYAEDPDDNFLPQTGKLDYVVLPEGININSVHTGNTSDQQSRIIRLDTGVTAGDFITPYYDPMISKLIVWGSDRRQALEFLSKALKQYVILGLPTNISFLKKLTELESFESADVGTDFIDQHMQELFPNDKNKNSTQINLCNNLQLVAELSAFIYTLLERDCNTENRHRDLIAFRMIGLKRPSYTFRDITLQGMADTKFTVNYQSLKNQLANLQVFINDQEDPLFDGQVNIQQDNRTDFTIRIDNKSGAYKLSKISPVLLDELTQEAAIVLKNSTGESRTVKATLENVFKSKQDQTAANANPRLAVAPMPGVIEKVLVKVGDQVELGQSLVIMSAMKMEYTIKSSMSGKVISLNCKPSQFVAKETVLVQLEALEGSV